VQREESGDPWLKPFALELFGGKYDPARLRFPDSLFASLPASDVRDWTAIRAWAGGLAAKLQPTSAAP
jgi:menaquinone-dependent protoporphyrinogen oxidase